MSFDSFPIEIIANIISYTAELGQLFIWLTVSKTCKMVCQKLHLVEKYKHTTSIEYRVLPDLSKVEALYRYPNGCLGRIKRYKVSNRYSGLNRNDYNLSHDCECNVDGQLHGTLTVYNWVNTVYKAQTLCHNGTTISLYEPNICLPMSEIKETKEERMLNSSSETCQYFNGVPHGIYKCFNMYNPSLTMTIDRGRITEYTDKFTTIKFTDSGINLNYDNGRNQIIIIDDVLIEMTLLNRKKREFEIDNKCHKWKQSEQKNQKNQNDKEEQKKQVKKYKKTFKEWLQHNNHLPIEFHKNKLYLRPTSWYRTDGKSEGEGKGKEKRDDEDSEDESDVELNPILLPSMKVYDDWITI